MYISRACIMACRFSSAVSLPLNTYNSKHEHTRTIKCAWFNRKVYTTQNFTVLKLLYLLTLMKQSPLVWCVRFSCRFLSYFQNFQLNSCENSVEKFLIPVKIHHSTSYVGQCECILSCLCLYLWFRWTYFVFALFFLAQNRWRRFCQWSYWHAQNIITENLTIHSGCWWHLQT